MIQYLITFNQVHKSPVEPTEVVVYKSAMIETDATPEERTFAEQWMEQLKKHPDPVEPDVFVRLYRHGGVWNCMAIDEPPTKVGWPWCEACQSYHHPENKSCFALQGKTAQVKPAESYERIAVARGSEGFTAKTAEAGAAAAVEFPPPTDPTAAVKRAEEIIDEQRIADHELASALMVKAKEIAARGIPTADDRYELILLPVFSTDQYWLNGQWHDFTEENVTRHFKAGKVGAYYCKIRRPKHQHEDAQ